MELTIGSDPEFVLMRNKKVVSAIPILKKDKHEPIDLGDNHKVYYDNTLIETNVPPANTKDAFVNNVKETFRRISAVVGPDNKIIALASAYFTKNECMHPDAMLAGCNPEYCAYSGGKCYPPEFVDTFRSAGGHIHIGRDDYKDYLHLKRDKNGFLNKDIFLIGQNNQHQMVKAMDIFVGAALVLIDNSEASKQRKKLYGKAGRYRPTPYGVEYRTPSNNWLASPKKVALIYDLTKLAFECVRDEVIEIGENADAAFYAINNDDSKVASQLVDAYVEPLSKENAATIYELSKSNIVKTIEEEWNIK